MSADTRGIVLEPPRSGRTVGAAAHVVAPLAFVTGSGAALRESEGPPEQRSLCTPNRTNPPQGRHVGIAAATDWSALRDCSRRGDIALDPVARFGATMLARNVPGRAHSLSSEIAQNAISSCGGGRNLPGALPGLPGVARPSPRRLNDEPSDKPGGDH